MCVCVCVCVCARARSRAYNNLYGQDCLVYTYFDDYNYNDDHFDVYNAIFQNLMSEATAHIICGIVHV